MILSYPQRNTHRINDSSKSLKSTFDGENLFLGISDSFELQKKEEKFTERWLRHTTFYTLPYLLVTFL